LTRKLPAFRVVSSWTSARRWQPLIDAEGQSHLRLRRRVHLRAAARTTNEHQRIGVQNAMANLLGEGLRSVPKRLTQTQRDGYLRDGLAFPVTVLSTGEAERYRAACDELELLLGGKPRTIEVRQMHLHWPWAHELATHPAILDCVEDLAGPNLLIWATELFIKHPRDSAVAVGWHRDRPYLGMIGGQVVTAWVALSNSSHANGCMRALPRSAEAGCAPATTARGAKEPLPPPGTESRVMDVCLRAGELSLHAQDVAHGSSPNLSDEKRVGFVIRYVTPDARSVQGRPPVLLARGTDAYGHFTHADPPRTTDHAHALDAMRTSAQAHLDVVLENLKHAGR
jgi:non-heme Fe2+,alpha-ketoglutarate-dependent halogenase